MGKTNPPGKVKLFAGLIFKERGIFDSTAAVLEQELHNPIDYISPEIGFFYTNYYEEEFGSGLLRRFIAFKDPVLLEGIYKTKIATNSIEDRFRGISGRTINIDPGYIDMAKLVLFSTKDFSHRIYAGDGIFAEVTMLYKGGTFTELPWTYPDYRTQDYLRILNHIRGIYKDSIMEN